MSNWGTLEEATANPTGLNCDSVSTLIPDDPWTTSTTYKMTDEYRSYFKCLNAGACPP